MNVLITLTSAGTDTGPFNLYSNVDNYTTAFETDISKGILVAGYTSTIVPPGTSAIRVKSIGICTNYVDITLTVPSTTTTTTTRAATTTTTTTAVGSPTTTTTTTAPVGPTTTTTTTPYVGPATTTTTTTAPVALTTTTTTTTVYVGAATTTTTTTIAATTTTTTTTVFVSCEQWQNDTLEEATITYTPCGSGTPVSGYALADTSSVCAVYGSITVTAGGPLTLVGACSAPEPATTTTTTTIPATTTTTTTIPATTTTTTTIPATTTTTTTALVYYSFPITTGYGDSASACGDSSTNMSIYGSSPSFLSNATFYNDYTLLSPFDGSNFYYSNTSNNEYVQISSIGSQTAGGSC